MIAGLTIECAVHFRRRSRGRQKLRAGPEPPVREPGRVPRVARLMALAIKFDQLLRSGQVASYAELARLGQVTPARVTQIMNLLCLAPDLQEALLFLPRVAQPVGRHREAHVQAPAQVAGGRRGGGATWRRAAFQAGQGKEGGRGQF